MPCLACKMPTHQHARIGVVSVSLAVVHLNNLRFKD